MRRSASPWIARAAAVIAGIAPLVGFHPLAAQQFDLNENQFNQWLTNGRGSPLQFFETQLEGQLARLHKTCNLTDEQRQKLELAGRGDIARFQSEMTVLHDELVGKTYNENEINRIYQQIQPLAQRVRNGILGDGSLFQKVRLATLDEEQLLAFDRVEAERNEFQYRAKVKLFIASLDSTAPMLKEQRDALLQLILNHTRPPKRWSGNQYDWYYVMFFASQIPPDEVSAILDEAQIRCFDASVRDAARLGPALKSQGLIPMDEEPSPAEARRDARQAPFFDIPVIQIGDQ